MKITKLAQLQNDKIVLENPHKGWYYHYYDNCITKYWDYNNLDEALENWPAFNHLYIRFAWSFIEAEEGVYDWHLIDDLMEKWAPKGVKAAFRITCKETTNNDERQVYATPKWVFEKCGAKGKFVGPRGDMWLPDYADPIFLEKLENFLKVFGARYDRAPWLEFVDVGSYGSWGEGHNFFSGEESWPAEIVRLHADLHRKYFKKTPVMINDDHIGSRADMTEEEKYEECKYYADAGFSLRDDSALVASCAADYNYDTLRRPWIFDMFWKSTPVDMELEHYNKIAPEVFKQGFPYLEALKRTHCTYAGWHGYPEPWLTDNKYFTEYAANRLGYWFFPEEIALPEYFNRGLGSFVDLTIKNNGWGKLYNKAECHLIFENIETKNEYIYICKESDLSRIMPNEGVTERYFVVPGENWSKGEYIVRIKFVDEYKGKRTPIKLALTDNIKYSDGSYAVSNTIIK